MPPFIPDTEQVLFEQQGRVAIFTLNRAEARNALSPPLTRALQAGIAWAAGDEGVGAVVITGAGAAFCAGGDVKAMGQRAEGPPPSAESQFRELQARHRGLAGALHQMRKPTISALPGPAAGAGMALALSTDFRVAADSAFLTTGYAGIGLSGDYGIAWLLTRVVGPARARELMLTGKRVGAADALAMGLVTAVAPAGDLMTETLALATQLAEGPGIAFAYMKDNLDEAYEVDHLTAIDREAERLLRTRGTNDHKEAVKAFAEKRKPVFTGS